MERSNKIFRSAIALLLAVNLTTSALPFGVVAEESYPKETIAVQETTEPVSVMSYEETQAAPETDSTEPPEIQTPPETEPTEPPETQAPPETDPTEPSENQAPPETDPIEPSETQVPPETDPTEPIETESAIPEEEIIEPDWFEQLVETQSLQQLHDAMMANPQAVYAMTEEGLTALKNRAEELYAALEDPTQDDADYYELITETVDLLQEKTRDTIPETLEESTEPEYFYADLYAGNLTIMESGGTTTLTGYRYDGNSTVQKINKTVSGTELIKVHVYQSNHQSDYTQTGIINGTVMIPEPSRVEGWGSYITNNTDVEGVISEWIGKNRPATSNRIAVSGKVNCELVLDNIYSTFQTHAKSRQDGGISFVTASGTKNATLTLKIRGDNRFGNIYYCAAKGNNNKIIFENDADQTETGTLTVANIANNSNGNYWCAAIGGNDNGGLAETCDGIVINSGTIYTGTNAKDDCTAIGGGGNGYGGITINGGTVTAVVTSSGAAIGGGIGKTSTGGPATVTITGGRVYAYNNSCTSGAYSNKGVKYIPAAAIGGGSSAQAVCDNSVINITGGDIYAQSVGGTAIGGGSSSDNNGGSTTVNISGGTIEAYSIPGTISGQEVPAGVAIGGGTGYNKGGSATLNVSGDAILYTGSIGGGGFGNKTNADGVIGFAKVNISSGYIRGQVVMEGTGSEFNMSGGIIDNASARKDLFVKKNGGAACVETGTVQISGSALIQNTVAELGGAIYLSNGNVQMSNGAIKDSNAQFGGAVYVTGGNFTITGGTIDNNSAVASNGEGGAVYVSGGNITVGSQDCTNSDCLTVSNNTAVNGGAFAVAGATPVMYCGTLSGNHAEEKGGALYVSGSGGFTMYGGVIDGGAEEANAQLGGGVYLANGTFTLDGENASIQGNRADNGAGVYLAGGLPALKSGTLKANVATASGGGIYIDGQQVTLAPEGTVRIDGNTAVDGAGIYICGTAENRASFAVDKNSTGTVEICDNTASGSGAGVCINNGLFTLDSSHITLQKNTAGNGGAVAVLSGDFTMSDGIIGGEGNGNIARNGGAVYVDGGNAAISGGTVSHNTAEVNGGGIAVNNGNIVMSGGCVDNNTAVSGSGGGMFATSSQGEVHVKVYSGRIRNNTAAVSGGAVGLQGGSASNIEVQIGVNLLHTFAEGILTPIAHDPYLHTYCPEIAGNTSSVSGGAFYITGGAATVLNIFCLEESNNACSGDTDINNEHLSNFLMVEGGKVTISTAQSSGCDENYPDTGNYHYGHADITGSVHVAGGTLDLFGSTDNPGFRKYITVDLTKQEDYYHDHRVNKGHVKLSYYENFDYHGIVDSTRTAMDLVSGQGHTISDSLYKHEGYDIYGWNTDPDATPMTTDGWYDNGKTYVFVLTEGEKKNDGRLYYVGEELLLYAIWEPNGYTVRFDPNVPEGETYTGEKMPEQPFTYNVSQSLFLNTYSRTGYLFRGWTYKDDNGVQKSLTDGQSVMNLTAVKGGTVILKAVWEECATHNIQYTVTQETDHKAVITKTCTLCGCTGTATFSASDAVYDKTSHPASLVFSDEAWFKDVSADITYIGTKIGKTDSVEDPQTTTNAGDYTATVTLPTDTVVTIQYQIAKAPQAAPAAKPTYTEPEQNTDLLTVHPIAQNVSSESNLEAEYSARYYEDGQLQETGWHQAVLSNGTYQAIQIPLKASLKYYFVYVRYAEGDNYLPSPEVMADGTFLWEGNIRLTFVVDPGITYLPVENTGELKIDITLDDVNYYLTGGNSTVTVEGNVITAAGGTKMDILLITGPDENGDFIIQKNPDVTLSEEAEITVRIGTTKPKPSVTGVIEEKQRFAPITSQDGPEIERSSAYTVLYTVKNYDPEVYKQPVLQFSPAIPAGTTVILQSRDSGGLRYWSYRAAASTTEISMSSFVRMSGSGSYQAENGDLALQFVVNFSRVEGGCAASDLQTKLILDKKIEDTGAPDLSGGVPQDVALEDAAFSLLYNIGEGLAHRLSYSFGPDIAASRWDDRELALVVSGSGLPDDAVLSAQVNGVWRTCRPYEPGKYIVPLGSQNTGTVELTLKSDMFPQQVKNYQMECRLYMSRSVADGSPLNGSPISDSVTCTFSSTDAAVAVSVSEGTDRHLFSSGEEITVQVNHEIPNGYSVKVQLQHKDQETEVYVNTGRKAVSTGGQYTFDLNGCADGSYRIVAIAERSDGFAVAEAPYYFIIQ